MTTRNRPRPLLLACLATTTLLTACTTDSPEAGRPNTNPPTTVPTSASPSTTESSGTTAPSTVASTPPARPATAVGASLAAGEAFIGYYVDLLNYSYATGAPDAFLSESDKGCVGCQGLADYVRKTNAKNGGLQGDYRDQLVSVKEIYRGKSGRVGGSATIKTGNYQERTTPGASPIPQPAGSGTMEFTLSPSGGNWVMYEMQINE